MNKRLLFLYLLFSSLYAQAQKTPTPLVDSVKTFLDRSLQIIKDNALNKDKVNWDELREQVYRKVAGAQTYEDLIPAYPFIFEQIDDHHGRLIFKQQSYGWKGNSQPQVNEYLRSSIKNRTEVHAEKIGKDIAYLSIPENNDFGNKHLDSIGRSIKQAIAKIHDKHIKGWILDLRLNTGGNMYPILAGLTDFLAEGKIGGFVTPAYQPDGNWIVIKGAFYVDMIKVSALPHEGYPIKGDMPIAVLVGEKTASAGEMVAIATIGRPKSVRVGETSAGYTTVNQGFKINDLAGLNLAVAYATDRNGKVYPKNLDPEIVVKGGDHFEKLSDDRKVKAAISWLRKN
jgi:carboxyl-terminal processing protease